MGIEGGSSNNEIQSQEINQSNNEQVEINQAEQQRSGEELEGNSTIDNEGERKQIAGKDEAENLNSDEASKLDKENSIEDDSSQEQQEANQDDSPEKMQLDNQDTIEGESNDNFKAESDNIKESDSLDSDETIEDANDKEEDKSEDDTVEDSLDSDDSIESESDEGEIESSDKDMEKDSLDDEDTIEDSNDVEDDSNDSVEPEDAEDETEDTEDKVDDQEESEDTEDEVDNRDETEDTEDEVDNQEEPEDTEDEVDNQEEPEDTEDEVDNQDEPEDTEDEVDNQDESEDTEDEVDNQDEPEDTEDEVDNQDESEDTEDEVDNQDETEDTEDEVDNLDESEDTEDEVDNLDELVDIEDEVDNPDKQEDNEGDTELLDETHVEAELTRIEETDNGDDLKESEGGGLQEKNDEGGKNGDVYEIEKPLSERLNEIYSKYYDGAEKFGEDEYGNPCAILSPEEKKSLVDELKHEYDDTPLDERGNDFVPESADYLKDSSISRQEAADGSQQLWINYKWPEEDGFKTKDGVVDKSEVTIQKGDVIDRVGHNGGRFTSPVKDGKPYSTESRALPYYFTENNIENEPSYHQFRATDDITPVNIRDSINNVSDKEKRASFQKEFNKSNGKTYEGEIGQAFSDDDGGGIQYHMPMSIQSLINLGLLEEL